MGFFEKLVAGLGKTRDNIVSGMDSIFHGFSRIDDGRGSDHGRSWCTGNI